MATDILDEHRFKSQCSLYESTKDSSHRPTTPPPTTVLRPPSMSAVSHNRRVKYPTQTGVSSSSTTNSIHNRPSGSTDILSFIRSFAMKPFKTSSMSNAIAGGQTSNVIGGTNISTKSPVNLLRYRPLSDVLTDQTSSYTQSTHAVEEFLKRMGWPINTMTDEGRVKWNTAMKFLIPAKFDVTRAIELYRTHENLRKNEHLDRIWINNPHLVREIQSGKFFSLPQIPTQPLTVIFTVSNINNLISNESLSQSERELITLQALICQLDVATESIEVQQNGLNFIYDMQNCTTSQFDINLSKKILKLLQGGYPAMLKNIFIISSPKWFRVVYKVIFYSVEEIREYLTSQYGYSLDTIPITLGGTYDPILSGNIRYQICLSKLTNNQSICYPYYIHDEQIIRKKSSNNILFYNIDHHHNQEKSIQSPPSSSLLALVSLRRSYQSPTRKRESSPSIDNDKRQRSNESLIEEEEYNDDQLKRHENSYRLFTGQQERNDYEIKTNMNKNDKCDIRRSITSNSYKPLNEIEFLAKTPTDIRQEFRKMPNPPAKDTHAAKDEKNLDKSRYRDVIPGELTRVKLQPDIDDKHDFINANYVSGYNNQEKAYIFTQGPLQHTVKDFWRMIWQENISIIVMTTNIRESGTNKCYCYWPLETNEYLNSGLYQIQNIKSEEYGCFVVTILLLKKKNHSEIRTIYHAHYLKWPDHGVPSGTKDALLFLEKVEYYKQLTQTKAPILLHCSAGIGRTGTFCAIDIGIKQYLNEKIIDIPTTVIKMRQERAGSVQTEDQYLFAHLALMDFIRQQQQQTIQERIPNLELMNNKKSLELNQNNTLSSLNSYESLSQRTKTSSDSSVISVQHVISSTNESNRSYTSIEQIPYTDNNGIDTKIRI